MTKIENPRLATIYATDLPDGEDLFLTQDLLVAPRSGKLKPRSSLTRIAEVLELASELLSDGAR